MRSSSSRWAATRMSSGCCEARTQIDARALGVAQGHDGGGRLESFALRDDGVRARRDPGEGEAPLIVGGRPVRHPPVARLEAHARGRERALERVLHDPGHLAGRRRRRHGPGREQGQTRHDRRSEAPAHTPPRGCVSYGSRRPKRRRSGRRRGTRRGAEREGCPVRRVARTWRDGRLQPLAHGLGRPVLAHRCRRRRRPNVRRPAWRRHPGCRTR